MASTLKYILQSISNNQYLTASGWSTNISDAKSFTISDLDGLSLGDYKLITIYTIT